LIRKFRELKPVPFTSAIDLGRTENMRSNALILYWQLSPSFFVNAGIITESTNRLVHPGEFFENDAPFKFEIQNKNLKGIENEDFTLNVKLTGKEIPETVTILVDGMNIKRTARTRSILIMCPKCAEIKNLPPFLADGFNSKDYDLEVLPNPIVLNFDVELQYPKYTKKKNEYLKNTGDLSFPVEQPLPGNSIHGQQRIFFLHSVILPSI